MIKNVQHLSIDFQSFSLAFSRRALKTILSNKPLRIYRFSYSFSLFFLFDSFYSKITAEKDFSGGTTVIKNVQHLAIDYSEFLLHILESMALKTSTLDKLFGALFSLLNSLQLQKREDIIIGDWGSL